MARTAADAAVAGYISSYPPIWPTRPPEDEANFDNRAANRIRAAAHSFEGKCFGVVVAGRMDEAAREAMAGDSDFAREVLHGAQSAQSFFVDPTGALVGDPVSDEGIGYARLDLSRCVEPKRFHDVAAGYNRFDVFELTVTRRRQVPVRFDDPADLLGSLDPPVDVGDDAERFGESY